MPSTPRPSVGIVRHELSTERSRAVSGGKSGLVSSTVGFARSVFSFPAAEISLTPRPRA